MTEISELIRILNDFLLKVNATPPPPPERNENHSTIKGILQSQNLHFECYDETCETFDEYVQRLENYYQLKGLTDVSPETMEEKKMILINCLGSKYYHLLFNITAPDLPASKTYDCPVFVCVGINLLSNEDKF